MRWELWSEGKQLAIVGFCDVVRLTGGVCGGIYFLSPELFLPRFLCSLTYATRRAACGKPTLCYAMQVAASGRSRTMTELCVEVFIHSTCTESYPLGDWLKGCAVEGVICAMGIQLGSRLF